MTNDLTPYDLVAPLRSLVTAFGRPMGTTIDELHAEYHRRLTGKHLTRADVERGVAHLVETWRHERRPRPADLLHAIHETRPRRPDTARDHGTPADRDICPTCQTEWHYAGYRTASGEVHPRLRCGCARTSPGWTDPAALAWRETDPRLAAPRTGDDTTRAARLPG